MKTVFRRILTWSAAGAAGAVGHALVTAPSLSGILNSVFIGTVSGAAAGAVASIPIERLSQTILTGATGGLCIGILSFWLLGSKESFGAHVASARVGGV